MNHFTPTQPTPPGLLEQAFERHYPAIFRYFWLRGAEAGSANDLAASVFELALAHLDQYDPHKAQIQTWLFAIAHNLSVNHWKSQKGDIALNEELPDDGLPLEEIVIRAQTKEQVFQALQALDGRSRELIALKFSSGFSNREIARLSGISETNVGVILYRSLTRLRRLLATTQAEVDHEQ